MWSVWKTFHCFSKLVAHQRPHLLSAETLQPKLWPCCAPEDAYWREAL